MRLSILVTGLVPLALAATGCSAFDEGGASTSDGVTIAAGFYPLAYVAERVAGDDADVELLTQPGAEPHDLELDVSRTAELARADLVVYEHGFQPAVDDAVAQDAEGVTLDAADVVDLKPAGSRGEPSDEGHADLDPHFWQDPLQLADLADAVADKLAAIDPDHADDYRANAADLRGDLQQLDHDYRTGLAHCERDTIVVSHDAFGYLEKYGVKVAPLVGLSPGAEPSAAVLGDLHHLIEKDGITTVFSEPLEPDLVASLAADLDVRAATLDPVEGLTAATKGEDYLSLMQSNLAAIREADGCR